MTNTETFAVEDRPNPDDIASLENAVNTFNVQRTGYQDFRPLGIFLRGEKGELEAGISGWTWGDCCEVKTLWVDESRRRQGLGTRLLRAAETEASARGCRLVVLDTHSFQAPAFYRQLGYEVVGVMENYPRGYQKLFFKKQLTPM